MLEGMDGDGGRWKAGPGRKDGRGLGSEAPGNLSFELPGQLSKIVDCRMWCVLTPR